MYARRSYDAILLLWLINDKVVYKYMYGPRLIRVCIEGALYKPYWGGWEEITSRNNNRLRKPHSCWSWLTNHSNNSNLSSLSLSVFALCVVGWYFACIHKLAFIEVRWSQSNEKKESLAIFAISCSVYRISREALDICNCSKRSKYSKCFLLYTYTIPPVYSS